MQEKWNFWYSKISITFVLKVATAENFMTIMNHLLTTDVPTFLHLLVTCASVLASDGGI